jgi:hypothetical protein
LLNLRKNELPGGVATAAVLITRQAVKVLFWQGSATGNGSYSETQRPNTNITFSNEAAQ